MIRTITNFFRRVFYGGTKKLFDYEIQIIEAILTGCTSEEQMILRQQLNEYSFVQRIPDTRFLVFYFDGGRSGGEPSVLLDNKKRLYRFASISSLNNKHHCTMITTKGRLLSLEFTAFPESISWSWDSISMPAKKGIRDMRANEEAEEHEQ